MTLCITIKNTSDNPRLRAVVNIHEPKISEQCRIVRAALANLGATAIAQYGDGMKKCRDDALAALGVLAYDGVSNIERRSLAPGEETTVTLWGERGLTVLEEVSGE